MDMPAAGNELSSLEHKQNPQFCQILFTSSDNSSYTPRLVTYLRAISVIECGLIGRPATLFPVEPESFGTDTKLEIRHPSGPNINNTSHHACDKANKQHTHPTRPRIMCTLD
jgi:hypothetical protein